MTRWLFVNCQKAFIRGAEFKGMEMCLWTPGSGERRCVSFLGLFLFFFSLPEDNTVSDSALIPAPSHSCRGFLHFGANRGKNGHRKRVATPRARLCRVVFMRVTSKVRKSEVVRKALVRLPLLSLAPFFLPPGQSQVQSAVLLPSISPPLPLTLPHTHARALTLDGKKTQGCLLDLVLYQIKVYSTCLPECCAPHGCTVWLKVSVVISFCPAEERGRLRPSQPPVHMAAAEFVEL